jgi:glycosyltransferase A (GT-A) superfamily protein (DUF2064 family)
LTSAIISDAFSKLENHDVVIGPTYDGGYYLLGMKLLHEPFFKIKTGAQILFSDTINDFENGNMHILEKLSDIDEEKDLPEHWK